MISARSGRPVCGLAGQAMLFIVALFGYGFDQSLTTKPGTRRKPDDVIGQQGPDYTGRLVPQLRARAPLSVIPALRGMHDLCP